MSKLRFRLPSGAAFRSGAAAHPLLAGILALSMGACAPVVDQRGNLPKEEQLAQIQPGITTKDEVTHLLGTPSTVATFDDKTWYYISKRTEQTAFLKPETVDQEVVAIAFDDGGVVREVKRRNLGDAEPITPVARTTPAPGKELTFLEQLLGNVGKFGGADKKGRGGGDSDNR